jgi:hypothetical protein
MIIVTNYFSTPLTRLTSSWPKRNIAPLPILKKQFCERDAWALMTCLGLGTVGAFYAGLVLRGLFADGSDILLRMMQYHSFYNQEPSRITTTILLEAPTLAAIGLGIGDLHAVAQIFSVCLNVLPLLGIGLCFFMLPADRKEYFLLPAFAAFGGMYCALYGVVSEALLATAYFWVLFYLILFGHESLRWRALIIALAIPTLEMDEVMVFLAPLLTLASLWRRDTAVGAWNRTTLLLLAPWFTAVAIHAAFEVRYPYSVSNRDAFIEGMVHLRWLGNPHSWVNGPAFLMLCAGAALLTSILRPTWSNLLLGSFAVVAFQVGAGAFVSDKLISPVAQFNSRYIAALLSFPLGLAVLASLCWPRLVRYWATSPTLAIVLILGLAGAAWNVAAAQDWVRFTDTFRAALARHEGLVPWDTVLGELSQDDAARFKRMNWLWTSPELSIVLSPGGNVRTMINNPVSGAWRPFNPAVAAELPSSSLYSTREYRATLERAKIKVTAKLPVPQ